VRAAELKAKRPATWSKARKALASEER